MKNFYRQILNGKSSDWMLVFTFFISAISIVSLIYGLGYLLNDLLIQDIHWEKSTIANWSFFFLVGYVLSYIFVFINQNRIQMSFDLAEKYILKIYMISLISLPMFSRDLFAYLGFGRLWSIYGLNPYAVGYKSISDEYSPYAWFEASTNYGPLATLISYFPGMGSQISVIYGIFIYKILTLLSCLVFLWLLRRLLEQLKLSVPIYLMIALHPMILIEGLVNSHNDVFVLPLLVIIIASILQKKWMQLALVAPLLPLFKTPLGIITAFVAFYFLFNQKIRHFLVVSGLTCLGMGLFLFSMGTFQNIQNYTSGSQLFNSFSFLGAFEWLLIQLFYEKYAATGVAFLSYFGPKIGSIASILFLSFFIWKKKNEDILKNLSIVMMVIVFFFATQYWPWYGLWFFMFPFFVSDMRFKAFGVLICLSGFVIYSPHFSNIVGLGYQEPLTAMFWPIIFMPYFLIFIGYQIYRNQKV
jgi:hypothetical protein